MKERSIRFTTEEVKAVLDGRKTQKRMIVKNIPETPRAIYADQDMTAIVDASSGYLRFNWHKEAHGKTFNDGQPWSYSCPFGKAGDGLWVREKFWSGYELDENEQVNCDKPIAMYYADTQDRRPCDMDDSYCEFLFGDDKRIWPSWKPSIHMPRTAARIFLEITNIRVERVQDISQDDICAEGVCYGEEFNSELCTWRDSVYGIHSTRKKFWQKTWQSINGKESWESNPFVWVIEFKRK